jgi:hypothetical protein
MGQALVRHGRDQDGVRERATQQSGVVVERARSVTVLSVASADGVWAEAPSELASSRAPRGRAVGAQQWSRWWPQALADGEKKRGCKREWACGQRSVEVLGKLHRAGGGGCLAGWLAGRFACKTKCERIELPLNDRSSNVAQQQKSYRFDNDYQFDVSIVHTYYSRVAAKKALPPFHQPADRRKTPCPSSTLSP